MTIDVYEWPATAPSQLAHLSLWIGVSSGKSTRLVECLDRAEQRDNQWIDKLERIHRYMYWHLWMLHNIVVLILLSTTSVDQIERPVISISATFQNSASTPMEHQSAQKHFFRWNRKSIIPTSQVCSSAISGYSYVNYLQRISLCALWKTHGQLASLHMTAFHSSIMPELLFPSDHTIKSLATLVVIHHHTTETRFCQIYQ